MSDILDANGAEDKGFTSGLNLEVGQDDGHESVALFADSFAITNVKTPRDVRSDSTNLVGYMNHLSVDPNTAAVSAHIIQGKAQYHSWLINAYEKGDKSALDTLEPQDQEVPGMVQFAVDSFHRRINFKLFLDVFDPASLDTLMLLFRGFMSNADINSEAVKDYHLIFFLNMPSSPENDINKSASRSFVFPLKDCLLDGQLDMHKLKEAMEASKRR